MKKVFGQTVRDLKREVNKKVLKVPGIEQKILDATNNESWGPHGSHLADIAQATYNYHEYQLIMTVIWRRINDTGKNWRHVYKGLIVLEYLVVNGSERVVDEIRQHARQILALSDFQYIDSSGKDRGFNVRKKSESLAVLISSKEKIQEVRGKSSANREKFHGKIEDPDMNGKERARFHHGNFGDNNNNIDSGNEIHQFGKKVSNSDIVENHSIDSDNDRYLEHKLSEEDISAPPSYEEAIKGAQIDIHKERDASTLTSSPVQEALPCEPKRTSSAESANHETSIKLEPCGSDPAAQQSASSTEMDLFGSFTDDSVNSSAPTPMMSTTNMESDLTSILGFNDNSAIPSSSLSVVNKPFEDPFGGSPFKALPQEDSISQPQKETSLNLSQFSFGSVSFPEPVPSLGATAAVENYSGIAYGKTNNESVSSFCQDLPSAQTDNDVLGELFSQIRPTATFSEATPTVMPATSQTAPSNLLTQTPLSDPTNPFVQSDAPSKEASPNPFIQPSLSSQEILPNPFAETRLPLQASPNPFAESGPSMQDLSPNPFALSGVPTEDPKSNITESTLSVSVANNASHLVMSSNGLPLTSISQSVLPSSKSATDHVELGLLASQSKLGLSSSKSDSNLVEKELPAVVTSQGSSPNYMTQSNLSSQTIPNLTQPGLSAPAVSQGLPPNYTVQSGLSSQATTNAYSELTTSATQGLSSEYITQLPQPTSNLTQSGLTAPLVAQGLPAECVAQPSLLSQATSSLIQSETRSPLSAEGISHSYIAQSVLSSQTTHTLPQSGFPSPSSQGFPQTSTAQSGVSSLISSSTTLSGIPAPQTELQSPPASEGLPQMNISEYELSSQTSSNTISTCLPASTVTKGFSSDYVAQSASMASSTVQATSSTATVLPTKTTQPKEKFEPKSTVWADTLSRGLVNLDISGVKTNPLADIGIDFDSINRKEKMKEEKKTSTSVSTITMGKAMGSGSGLGRTGATGLAPMMGPGMGIGNFGGMGCYSGGINQQMGMGMGINMSMGMGQGAARQPGFGMPPGSSMAPHPGMPGIGNNQTMEMNGHGFQRPHSGGYS